MAGLRLGSGSPLFSSLLSPPLLLPSPLLSPLLFSFSLSSSISPFLLSLAIPSTLLALTTTSRSLSQSETVLPTGPPEDFNLSQDQALRSLAPAASLLMALEFPLPTTLPFHSSTLTTFKTSSEAGLSSLLPWLQMPSPGPEAAALLISLPLPSYPQ